MQTVGFAENLRVTVKGLAAGTALDIFVIQVPTAPFGLAWYLGDLPVSGTGMVTKVFTSRLNEETFAVAPGSVAAPRPHKAHPSRTPRRTRSSRRCTPTTSGSGSTRPTDAKKNGCTRPASGDAVQRRPHRRGAGAEHGHVPGKLKGPLSRID